MVRNDRGGGPSKSGVSQTGQTYLAGIFETVREVDVNHGEWLWRTSEMVLPEGSAAPFPLPMLKEIGINDREARRYMEIARNLKSANFADLPASPTALLELSRMDPSDIGDGIESGECRKARQDQE